MRWKSMKCNSETGSFPTSCREVTKKLQSAETELQVKLVNTVVGAVWAGLIVWRAICLLESGERKSFSIQTKEPENITGCNQ